MPTIHRNAQAVLLRRNRSGSFQTALIFATNCHKFIRLARAIPVRNPEGMSIIQGSLTVGAERRTTPSRGDDLHHEAVFARLQTYSS
jgi:hypothetical protein